ncbi:hypothetical protein AwErysi_02140 [Erysipelotrichaceae bacterium]|nr:hypothetical protein AwErysi_02140 [Erysipelotrichaceae bacterium]
MSYSVELSKQAEKTLKKLDKQQQILLLSWIKRNLVGCKSPRISGKPLTGDLKGSWRYRVGIYRIITSIEDEVMKI